MSFSDHKIDSMNNMDELIDQNHELFMHNYKLNKKINEEKYAKLFLPNRGEYMILISTIVLFSIWQWYYHFVFYQAVFMLGLLQLSLWGFSHGYSSLAHAQNAEEKRMKRLAESDEDYVVNINFFNFILSMVLLMIAWVLINFNFLWE